MRGAFVTVLLAATVFQVKARAAEVARIRARADAEQRKRHLRSKLSKLIGGIPEPGKQVAVRQFGAVQGDGSRVESRRSRYREHVKSYRRAIEQPLHRNLPEGAGGATGVRFGRPDAGAGQPVHEDIYRKEMADVFAARPVRLLWRGLRDRLPID